MTTEELEAAGFAPLTDPYEMPREEEELERCKKQLENGKAGPIPYRMRWIDYEFVEIWAKPRVKPQVK